ncbi:hypothetical protein [Legionella tunisiensis]|nr:hypothetical protein [Legionella tunisiensis]
MAFDVLLESFVEIGMAVIEQNVLTVLHLQYWLESLIQYVEGRRK